ncbi:PLD nuclease N-terminal domain-containing protein [Dictyoglomus thermophilum]|uniref:Cardiolipin synthase N-terminal domain-containing protein n=2 Tax=Dictyoglomus thermophilum TaxID=14 RepID=B5YAT7_DICT6|nr:PLD nuclease N-terminal domain-containing protein [Dictyoglomus thermophilum]ACI19959.1 hypothetical protein DICTH_0023 [Dictyoglomus thermophilum H-6-12]MCX7720866.1 PLD nuclease N-terminal domain-containing protein [Dictyoglomus thermophilum]TYT23991.1 PLDc_N domain-containing protein [Dictyoglomus thermophilum]
MEGLRENFILFLPLLLIQLVFQILAIVDLIKRNKEEIRWENKIIWAIIILAFGILGPMAYFVFGRK